MTDATTTTTDATSAPHLPTVRLVMGNKGCVHTPLPAAADAAAAAPEPDSEVCCRCAITMWAPGNEMLLCDGPGCHGAYHLLCLRPPLGTVPEGKWLCEKCMKDEACVECAGKLSHAGNEILLCDCCNQGFHQQCLVPPFAMVPAGEWLCASCAPAATPAAAAHANANVSAQQLATLHDFVRKLGGAADLLDGWSAKTEMRRQGTSAGATDTCACPLLSRPPVLVFLSSRPLSPVAATFFTRRADGFDLGTRLRAGSG